MAIKLRIFRVLSFTFCWHQHIAKRETTGNISDLNGKQKQSFNGKAIRRKNLAYKNALQNRQIFRELLNSLLFRYN